MSADESRILNVRWDLRGLNVRWIWSLNVRWDLELERLLGFGAWDLGFGISYRVFPVKDGGADRDGVTSKEKRSAGMRLPG